MIRFGKSLASAIVSVSLIAGSTAAAASTDATPIAPSSAAPASASGWMTLAMLTPTSAAVLGGSTAAAAQPDVPPPPPPEDYSRGPGTPPIPVLIAWLAVIGVFIYIVTKGNSSSKPNSPA